MVGVCEEELHHSFSLSPCWRKFCPTAWLPVELDSWYPFLAIFWASCQEPSSSSAAAAAAAASASGKRS
jgi:hypothetical protein